ncbi:phosphate ABC transporter permease PstA [Entomobacter blattae]|uniref:Phosphate transport system permease protein PstA n=1 Tax=Entomobacter blattae TaxID=2762277 RepID=A0A7H1NNW0_9PROT|nr:phosphate ABC transporter permease PstA [Entomobacter blattae]QNT77470.1 Phosphate transport system permease protein PstA [Entomobacter blattae]
MHSSASSLQRHKISSVVKKRRLMNQISCLLAWGATALVVMVIFSILLTLLWNGIRGLTLFTFTHITAAQGLPGGLLNAIMGSLIQVSLATCLGTPLGILAGIFLSEFNRFPALSSAVRFVSDMLLSAPSILIGLFVYLLLVASVGHFSGFAGACALAILIIPVIIRTTEDSLHLVPSALREAGAALGTAKWKTVLFICLPSAKTGILTGILLGIARISGETAPLLFTSLGNMDWSIDLAKPMASLPLVIYAYIDSADTAWIHLAWTAALLITIGVLGLNIVARSFLSTPAQKQK